MAQEATVDRLQTAVFGGYVSGKTVVSPISTTKNDKRGQISLSGEAEA